MPHPEPPRRRQCPTRSRPDGANAPPEAAQTAPMSHREPARRRQCPTEFRTHAPSRRPPPRHTRRLGVLHRDTRAVSASSTETYAPSRRPPPGHTRRLSVVHRVGSPGRVHVRHSSHTGNVGRSQPSADGGTVSLPRRTLFARPAAFLAAVSAAALLPLVPIAPAAAEPWPGHPDRSLVRYVVRPGDTATGLAVRYHAWTAELISLNRLGANGTLRQGQELKIPIVISAVRRARGQAPRPRVTRKHAHPRKQRARPVLHSATPPGRGWRHSDMTRDQVRRLVAATARRYDVPPKLALAIAWQESGWQQRRISSAGAIGVMQVMPDTGRWMRWYRRSQVAPARHPRQRARGHHDDQGAPGLDPTRQQRDRRVLPRPRGRTPARLLRRHQDVRRRSPRPRATDRPYRHADLVTASALPGHLRRPVQAWGAVVSDPIRQRVVV